MWMSLISNCPINNINIIRIYIALYVSYTVILFILALGLILYYFAELAAAEINIHILYFCMHVMKREGGLYRYTGNISTTSIYTTN